MAGLYIHVPFCARRCIYCDFYSQTKTQHKKNYIKALVRELELRKNYLNGEPVKTIYFGGGTPSQLLASDFEQIFEAISTWYDLSGCEEVTLEANPDDISTGYLRDLKQFPFNRISLGVQSFNDEMLQFLNRRHDGKQAINAVRSCQQAGFDNLSIDLMYGLPLQTPAMWESDLKEGLALHIPHLSAYHLSYEEGTELYRRMVNNTIKQLEENTSILQFDILVNILKSAGYLHYEISGFCKPDNFARHNTLYWTDQKYLGVGPAAHSYNLISRQNNIASLSDYIRNISNNQPYFEEEKLDLKSKYNDYILTHLRTMWGVHLADLNKKFGQQLSAHFLKQSERYIEKRLLERKVATIRLTTNGILISDSIFRDLMK